LASKFKNKLHFNKIITVVLKRQKGKFITVFRNKLDEVPTMFSGNIMCWCNCDFSQ